MFKGFSVNPKLAWGLHGFSPRRWSGLRNSSEIWRWAILPNLVALVGFCWTWKFLKFHGPSLIWYFYLRTGTWNARQFSKISIQATWNAYTWNAKRLFFGVLGVRIWNASATTTDSWNACLKKTDVDIALGMPHIPCSWNALVAHSKFQYGCK